MDSPASASVADRPGRRLLQAGAAAGICEDKTKVASLIDSSFRGRCPCSTWCWRTVELLSKPESSSPALPLLYHLSGWNILSPLLSLQPSPPGANSISRNHLLCWCIRSSSSTAQVRPWDRSHAGPAPGSACRSSSLAVSATSAVSFSTDVSSPTKSSVRAGVNFFHIPVHVDILTHSHESQTFFTFLKDFLFF